MRASDITCCRHCRCRVVPDKQRARQLAELGLSFSFTPSFIIYDLSILPPPPSSVGLGTAL
jgi:hypothetical protein